MSQITELEEKALRNLLASARLLEACRVIREFMPEESARRGVSVERSAAERTEIEVVEHRSAAHRPERRTRSGALISAITEVMGKRGEPMTAREITEVMERQGFEFHGKKTPVAQVNQSLYNYTRNRKGGPIKRDSKVAKGQHGAKWTFFPGSPGEREDSTEQSSVSEPWRKVDRQPGLIHRVVEILQEAGRPMTPEEIVGVMEREKFRFEGSEPTVRQVAQALNNRRKHEQEPGRRGKGILRWYGGGKGGRTQWTVAHPRKQEEGGSDAA